MIMFLYRPERYGLQTPDDANVAEVIVGKRRNGPVDTCRIEDRGGRIGRVEAARD